MKLSEKWLRKWVNPDLDTSQLAHQLTMAGLEVESITPIGAELRAVCVGQIIEAVKHPNADRLKVCQVFISENIPPLTIVCGAANARAGLKVAVAQVGAILPGNFEIKQAKIRGIESSGMLCSAKELNLAETSEGILELPEDAPIGMNFSEYWLIPDQLFEINLTPNRGDCLSVMGIAREISALNCLPLQFPLTPAISSLSTEILPANVAAPQDCPVYMGRIIRGINPQATTPVWMQELLQRSGIRTIHPLVDITNYVMLELGQPLHGFDLSIIHEGIVVRHSQLGEQTTLLDGRVIRFTEPALVIADPEKILALAGIMGANSSAVTSNTTDIFLESAFFTPESIRPTLRHYSLASDSAQRFERGVDPQLTLRALNRATHLIMEITGGIPGPAIECLNQENLPIIHSIPLRLERIERLLGIKINDDIVEKILSSLGMRVQKTSTRWEITPPSYRFDLQIEADLIEELARVYGYDTLPKTALPAHLTMLPTPEGKLSLQWIRQFLGNRGYHEAINYSFVEPHIAQCLNPKDTLLTLKNPISVEMSAMRTSLWPGLLQTVSYNLNRQATQIRLFEIGVCFLQRQESLIHENRLAGVLVGLAAPEQWGMVNRPLDFFDLKGDIAALLAHSGEEIVFMPSTHPALHPGRAAELIKNGKQIGSLGQLHPKLQAQLDLKLPVYLFEMSLEETSTVTLPQYTSLSKFPFLRRDLAFVLPENISYRQITNKIQAIAGEMLQNIQLFDIYQGQGIPSGQRSIALSLIFQLDKRTLVDQEVNQAIEQIINVLKQDFQATLRG